MSTFATCQPHVLKAGCHSIVIAALDAQPGSLSMKTLPASGGSCLILEATELFQLFNGGLTGLVSDNGLLSSSFKSVHKSLEIPTYLLFELDKFNLSTGQTLTLSTSAPVVLLSKWLRRGHRFSEILLRSGFPKHDFLQAETANSWMLNIGYPQTFHA